MDERYVDPEQIEITHDASLFHVSRTDDPSGKANFILQVEPVADSKPARNSIPIRAQGLDDWPDGEAKVHAFVQ